MIFHSVLSSYLPALNASSTGISLALGVGTLLGSFVAMVELLSPGWYDNLMVPFSSEALLKLGGL